VDYAISELTGKVNEEYCICNGGKGNIDPYVQSMNSLEFNEGSDVLA